MRVYLSFVLTLAAAGLLPAGAMVGPPSLALGLAYVDAIVPLPDDPSDSEGPDGGSDSDGGSAGAAAGGGAAAACAAAGGALGAARARAQARAASGDGYHVRSTCFG